MNRINADVHSEILRKMARKTRLYPEAIGSIEYSTDSDE